MKLDKLRNSRVISTIGILMPLMCTIGLSILFQDIILSSILILVLIIFYTIGLGDSFQRGGKISMLPFKSRIIHSQYGNYFFIRFKNKVYQHTSTPMYNCYLYENKYWLFLSKISSECIIFDGDLDELSRKIEREIAYHNQKIENKNGIRDILDKWDGMTDDVIRREKAIDKVIK
tara:strand:- start:16180 stop:16704 length:525 start_codon:yes stop_codon:yes gene_type:complete